jgi:hypothetical protein
MNHIWQIFLSQEWIFLLEELVDTPQPKNCSKIAYSNSNSIESAGSWAGRQLPLELELIVGIQIQGPSWHVMIMIIFLVCSLEKGIIFGFCSCQHWSRTTASTSTTQQENQLLTSMIAAAAAAADEYRALETHVC